MRRANPLPRLVVKVSKPVKRRNVMAGFYDEDGYFHPIRASRDYDPGRTTNRKRKNWRDPKTGKAKNAKRKTRRPPLLKSWARNKPKNRKRK